MNEMTFVVALALGVPLTAMFGWMFGLGVGLAVGALTLAAMVAGWMAMSRNDAQRLREAMAQHERTAEAYAFPEDAWQALVRGQAQDEGSEHRFAWKLLLLGFSPAIAASTWLWYSEGNPYALIALLGVPLLFVAIATPARRRMRRQRHRWLLSDRNVRLSENGMSVGGDFKSFEKNPENVAVIEQHGCWMVVLTYPQPSSDTPGTPAVFIPFPPGAESVARAWAARLEAALR